MDFDAAILKVNSIDISASVFSNFWESTFDNSAGKIKLQASEPSPGETQGLITTITFEALADGASGVTYDSSSLALEPDDTDILDLANSTDASFTVQTPDTSPPLRSALAPSGTLAFGTTKTTISLSTDESATCRYSTTSGISYGSMTNTFSTTGGVSHSTEVSGLSDGETFRYFVKCADSAGNANTTDASIEFSVAQASTGGGGGGGGGGSSSDSSPPIRLNPSPQNTISLLSGVTKTTISLSTNEPATCAYSPSQNIPFSSMTTFSSTGGGAHSTEVGVASGQSYNFFVKCRDFSGNINMDDMNIEFATSGPGGGPATNGGGGRVSHPAGLKEGELIRGEDKIKVYIINYYGDYISKSFVLPTVLIIFALIGFGVILAFKLVVENKTNHFLTKFNEIRKNK